MRGSVVRGVEHKTPECGWGRMFPKLDYRSLEDNQGAANAPAMVLDLGDQERERP